MIYTHNSAQAGEYAGEAMKRLTQAGLSPTPDCFELWYVYYAGQSPEVSRAIDILVANGQKITQERCQELYSRFLNEGRSEEAMRRAGDQIKDAISTVSFVVRDVQSATHSYGDKLGGVAGRIDKVKDPGELKTILGAVVTDTRAMIVQNQRLEEQLDKSAQVMAELQSDLEKFQKEALTDGLTGLSNRKAFDAAIHRVSEEAQLSHSTFTLLMVDIDHFKSFNDNYGHQVGDQVLRLVARTLTDGVKGRDVAARYGGEEFAILLPDTGLQAGVVVGNALRKAVATKDVVNRANGERLARITMSVGVAEYDGAEAMPDLIERADAALYTAKHNGRNQVAAAPGAGVTQEKQA